MQASMNTISSETARQETGQHSIYQEIVQVDASLMKTFL